MLKRASQYRGCPAAASKSGRMKLRNVKFTITVKIKVTAFVVDHGPVKPAFGYRVEYPGYSAVISGDTKFSENLVHFAKGTDCLIHPAWSISSEKPSPTALRSIASAEDAAQVFRMTHPRLAVIYHYKHSAGVQEAIRAGYNGPFVIGKDLMTIHIGNSVTWNER
jgi:ribonuclease Z